MKFTNRLLLTALLVMTISVVSFAQRGHHGEDREHPSPEEMAKKQVERLTEVLDLTAEQAKKIEAINLKYLKEGKAKRDAMRDKKEQEREAMKAERKKVMDAHNAEIKTVLNEMQYAKYEGFRAAKKERKEHRGHGKKGKGKRGEKG